MDAQQTLPPPFFMNIYFDSEWLLHPGLGKYESFDQAKRYAASGKLKRLYPNGGFVLQVGPNCTFSIAT